MSRSFSRREALIGAGAVVTATLAASAPAGASAPRSSAPVGSLVMIIRHAEKPKGHHAPYGVTPSGEQDKESLTTRGWTRAGALVELFDPADKTFRAGLARPDRVLAADPAHGSKRPAQTVTPLADRLHEKLITTWAKGQEADVAKALDSYRGVTLVAWEHEKIPTILGHLGAISPAPPAKWPGDRFDLVWLLRRGVAGWTFSQVPQLLLAGDSHSLAH